MENNYDYKSFYVVNYDLKDEILTPHLTVLWTIVCSSGKKSFWWYENWLILEMCLSYWTLKTVILLSIIAEMWIVGLLPFTETGYHSFFSITSLSRVFVMTETHLNVLWYSHCSCSNTCHGTTVLAYSEDYSGWFGCWNQVICYGKFSFFLFLFCNICEFLTRETICLCILQCSHDLFLSIQDRDWRKPHTTTKSWLMVMQSGFSMEDRIFLIFEIRYMNLSS